MRHRISQLAGFATHKILQFVNFYKFWNLIALELYATFKPHRQKIAMGHKFKKKEDTSSGKF